MTINGTEIEEILKDLLQKKLKLSINNKQYRKGKLLLFKQNNYHIELTVMKNDIDIKRFEIPIPFAVERWDKDNIVYFDYRLVTLSERDKKILDMVKSVPTDAKSRFYDKIMEIKVI